MTRFLVLASIYRGVETLLELTRTAWVRRLTVNTDAIVASCIAVHSTKPSNSNVHAGIEPQRPIKIWHRRFLNHQYVHHFGFMYPCTCAQYRQTLTVYVCIEPRNPMAEWHEHFLISADIHVGVEAFDSTDEDATRTEIDYQR